MATPDDPSGRQTSQETVGGLIVAIAATDVVVSAVDNDAWLLPLKAVIVVAFVLWARRAGLSWNDLGCEPRNVGRGVKLGAIVALGVALVIAVLLAIPATREAFESNDVAHDSTVRQWLEPLVLIPFATVVFEEVIFRGVLLGAWLRVSPRTRAVVGSAVVFGLWHVPTAWGDGAGVVLGTVVVTTAAGVLFAELRLRSDSLAAPVVAHTAINSLAYVAAVAALHW